MNLFCCCSVCCILAQQPVLLAATNVQRAIQIEIACIYLGFELVDVCCCPAIFGGKRELARQAALVGRKQHNAFAGALATPLQQLNVDRDRLLQIRMSGKTVDSCPAQAKADISDALLSVRSKRVLSENKSQG